MNKRNALKYSILFFFLVAYAFNATGIGPPGKKFDSAVFIKKIDSIKEEYSRINYQGRHATSFYMALSAFPVLKDTRVVFRRRDISTTMQCRPRILSIIQRPHKRTIVMIFNRNLGRSRGVPVGELSYKARVGLFAHELSHVVDYLSRGAGELMVLGVRYLSKNGKRRVEHRIDRMVIWSGLGWPLYQFAKEVHKNPNITNDYRHLKETVYLQPAEIKELVSIVENLH